MKRLILLFCLIAHLQADRIVVTGGAGLIGTHLCRALLDEGHEVICIDNLSSGSAENLHKDANFIFIRHDICDPIDLEGPIHQIYNLACPASPVYYQKEPIHTLETCFIGTRNMLELARKHNAKFLHTSTSEVYGDPLIHPQKEEYWGHVNPNGIRSCYDEGKRVAESLIVNYRQAYGLDTKIVRIFNTYGPNMHPNDGRVISNFVLQALKNKPITVYGSGSQTRSICYVGDTVRGMMRLMAQGPEISGPINIGNPDEMTILELAERVIELTGSQSEIIFLDLPQDDPKKRCPDITLAKEQLGWKPTTPSSEGLQATIDYFKQ